MSTTRHTPDDPVQAAISAQAAEWFVQNRDPQQREARRAEFFAWLQESPACVREYLAIAALATDVQGLTAAEVDIPAIEERLAADGRSAASNVVPFGPDRVDVVREGAGSSTWRVSRLVASLLAASVVVALALIGLGLDRSEPGVEAFRTAHGEQRLWRLQDGSVMHLNSDSAVQVRFSESERVVTLEQGQALFKVAHEASRRFRVHAGVADVVAVGTQFDVYRRPDDALVTVVEGRVAVLAGSGGGPGAAVSAPASGPLVAGQQVRITASGSRVQPREVDIRNATAWTRKQIVLDGRKLGEVVQEFNRYGAVPIVVHDPVLARLQLGGVLDAYDTGSFLTFLTRMGGVEVVEGDGQIVVHRLKDGDEGGSPVQP